MRYFLELSYDGTSYHGWQIQDNSVTVQELLNNALSTKLRSTIEVVGAGRTDTGVHASQMYCHFDVNDEITSNDLVYHLNALLPKDIAIKRLIKVGNESHARFDAISRKYNYQISSIKNPFQVNRSWFYPYELNLDRMNEACEVIMSNEDFSCFSKSGTQTKTNICKISSAFWKNENDLLIFEIKADRFLRNMVRAIVGTLIEVGRGEMSLDQLKKVIESGDRSKAGLSVPAHGLYLSEIEYPESIISKS